MAWNKAHPSIYRFQFHSFNAHVYSFQSNAWVDMPHMIHSRSFHSSCLLDGDKWWITGDFTKSTGMNTSEYLQIGQTTSFQRYIDLPEGMYSHTMIRATQTSVIFVGNHPISDRVYLFNSRTERFRELPPMQRKLNSPQAGTVDTL